jgi:predicted DNA-binding protein (MmcQ/YjbR family)
MNIEEILAFCQTLKGTTENFPFDDRVLAIRVQNKIYGLIDVEEAEYINLKCDPEKAIELREEHNAIRPGYHMSKKLWNSVYLREGLSHQLIKELIQHSYDEVVKKLPKKLRDELTN